MSKFELFLLKNRMLFANFTANLVGVVIIRFLVRKTFSPLADDIAQAAPFVQLVFMPTSFILPAAITILYERPIRRYLDLKGGEVPIPEDLTIKARRRLLNEPFVLIALAFGMWLAAGALYSFLLWRFGSGSHQIFRLLSTNLITGLITITVAFFALERALQSLSPHLFPNGGLYKTPKTLRIRIRTRLAAVLLACNLIPLLTILHILQRTSGVQEDVVNVLDQVHSSIALNSCIFMGVGILLTHLLSRNLSRPLGELILVLQEVRSGCFDRRVLVTSSDEIGYTGDVVNEMTQGLKERDRMRQSLNLAMEVQQNLLPSNDPQIDGLDIAGTSIYCEETGGDYYDYLDMGKQQPGKISVVVGDVSDHGIQSALLMATGRALLRQRASLPGDIARIVSDVNRELAADVDETGQFMTLFYCEIDRPGGVLRWVRAGHDPAILYDLSTGGFQELDGRGLALGLMADYHYEQSQRELAPGQIIVIGTDGIWESRNRNNEMFGKAALKDIIQAHADESAEEIMEAIISDLEDFCDSLPREDDVTLVIIKVIQPGCFMN